MRKTLFIPMLLILGCGERPGTQDADGDGFMADEDCDDSNSAIYPGALEYCDGVDNDCDEAIDEMPAVDPKTWYADSDGDGFGDAQVSEIACDAPEGFVQDDTDCDDQSPGVHPDAVEVCDDNDVDEDCSGLADDEDPNVDPASQLSGYADSDGDGFGDPAASLSACTLPQGHVENAGDCDDTRAEVNPSLRSAVTA